VESTWIDLHDKARMGVKLEFASLASRARLDSWSIYFCSLSALLVCALIAALFVQAMISLSSGIAFFLREVHTATHTLRIGPPRFPAS
jgi:hypothetical protein